MDKFIEYLKNHCENIDESIDAILKIHKLELERTEKLLHKDFSPFSFQDNKEWVIKDWEEAQTIGFALAEYYDKIAKQYCDLKDYKNKK